MGVIERKQRQKNEVKSSILCAARQLVIEEGWSSLSIRKIADAIEYSVPVIYDHFENKEAIQLEFAREGFRILGEKIQEARDNHLEPSKQIEAMAMSYWDFAFTNKEFYQIMFGVGMPTCDMAMKVPEMETFRQLMQSSIQELISGSSQPEVNKFLKFYSLWSMLHGLVSINMVEQTSTHQDLNQMVLNDVITGFIKSITG
jgi:AcrR family transcriptional regulator